MKFWFGTSNQANAHPKECKHSSRSDDAQFPHQKAKILYVDFPSQNSSKSSARMTQKHSAEIFYPAFLSSTRYLEGLEAGREITQLQLHGLIAYTSDIRRAFQDELFHEIPRFAARLTAVAKEAKLPIVEIMAIDIGQNAIDENLYKLTGKISTLEGLIETVLAGAYEEYGLSKH